MRTEKALASLAYVLIDCGLASSVEGYVEFHRERSGVLPQAVHDLRIPGTSRLYGLPYHMASGRRMKGTAWVAHLLYFITTLMSDNVLLSYAWLWECRIVLLHPGVRRL